MSLRRKLLVFGILLTGVPLFVTGGTTWWLQREMGAVAQDGTRALAEADLEHMVQLATSATRCTSANANAGFTSRSHSRATSSSAAGV